MSGTSARGRRGQPLLALLAAVLAMAGLLNLPAAAADPAPDAAAKIEKSVADTLAAKDSTDFWVLFNQAADLSAAAATPDWNARGTAVVDALQQTAASSQAATRAELDSRKVSYQSFYIANALLIRGGSAELAQSLAKRGEVKNILSPRSYAIPEPIEGKAENKVNAVEWGVAAINADDAWSTFGTRGEGIVVANIDSGVDYTHPALVNAYRGNLGGSFDHNYNWFDPSNVCGNPSLAPCDNNDHGSHTMGTMVGDDGAGNQIGVAPGAKWIAAKGCESNGCSDTALLASGQWVLAPTDLTGANPRADLRPNIVNNSWGAANGSVVDPFYEATVNAWRASGIFPAFSNGNSGPGCNTSGSPGDYIESYSSGAFDVNGSIASFSSRGPGENNTIKPNLASPGVNVRSSIPGGGYDEFSGTSMASPHTAGTVALMWSAAPSLIGDLATTEQLLNGTAVDTSDLACGGTPQNNNVWGEGKLDAFAAVDQSPRGPTGTLSGAVTNAADSSPLGGVSLAVAGPSNRTLVSGADGSFSSTLPVGDYTVTGTKFGFTQASGTASVAEGQTATLNLALSPAASGTVSGHVRDSGGAPVGNATVTVLGTPIAAVTTGADGAYSFANVPHGTYQVRAAAGGCFDQQTQSLTSDGDETLDFTIPNRRDSFGNSCVLEGAGYVEGDTPLALSGDDAATSVALPFDFFFYGASYRNAFVSTNGHLNFNGSSTAFSNVGIPASGAPNAAIYPFWDDLVIDASSAMFTKLSGAAPNREFVIEWRNATFFGATGNRIDFEVALAENGDVSMRYRGLDPAAPRETGNSATVGVENATGTVALQYSLNTSTLADSQSIRFRPPANGQVAGTVTDFNDGLAVEGATVTAKQGSASIAETTVAADGTYRLRLLAGDYTIEVAKDRYTAVSTAVTVTDGAVITKDIALHTAKATLSVESLSFLGEAGQLRSATVGLGSASDLALTFQVSIDASWVWTVPGAGSVAPGTTRSLTVRADAEGLDPGVHTATISLTTNAGRTPLVQIPVTMVVPAYRKGVDVGGAGVTDANADAWVGDQGFTSGSFGYLGAGYTNTSKKAIAGTTDDALFQTSRESTGGYRFDALPAGVYDVELDFAELRPGLAPGRRVFDVSVNGELVLPGYDITARVGNLTADVHRFYVTVAEGGSIQVDLGARRGHLPPVINAVRITHRPDK